MEPKPTKRHKCSSKNKENRPETETVIDEIVPADALSAKERKDLEKLEGQIKDWADGYVQVGLPPDQAKRLLRVAIYQLNRLAS